MTPTAALNLYLKTIRTKSKHCIVYNANGDVVESVRFRPKSITYTNGRTVKYPNNSYLSLSGLWLDFKQFKINESGIIYTLVKVEEKLE